MTAWWVASDERFGFAHDLNSIIDAIAGNGIFSGFTVTGTGTDRVLTIAAGVGYANGTLISYAGGTKTPDAGDSTYARYDVLSLKSDGTITLTAGTPASSPTVPDHPSGETRICIVAVPQNASTLATGNCTDVRVLIKRYGTIGGTGTDGDVTYSTSGINSGLQGNYRNVTIGGGVTVSDTGGQRGVFAWKCAGNFTLTGTIDLTGAGGAGGSTGNGGNGVIAGQSGRTGIGLGGTDVGGAGKHGGGGGTTNGVGGGGGAGWSNGSDSTGAAGYEATGGIGLSNWTSGYFYPSTISICGGGGGGAGTGAGGDGAGGIYIECRGNFDGTSGTITAPGSNGASSGNCGAGGGGGGVIRILYGGSYTAPTTTTLTGGTGGTGASAHNGGNGGAGSVQATQVTP